MHAPKAVAHDLLGVANDLGDVLGDARKNIGPPHLCVCVHTARTRMSERYHVVVGTPATARTFSSSMSLRKSSSQNAASSRKIELSLTEEPP